MVNVQVKRSVRQPVDKSMLMRAALLTLESENASANADISVVIGNDALLRDLNLRYRNVDSPTDVLSFAADETDPDTQSNYLGDVVISLPRAQEQASSGGHALADELQLLVIHGVLHLLGYDHVEVAGKEKMQIVQNRILSLLGINLLNAL
jgi:probable rRNA maturation factor